MANLELIYAKQRVLFTERLKLRPVTLNDAADMYEYAASREHMFYVFDEHHTIEETEENILAYFLKDPVGKYGIELMETGKMIGTIDLRIKPKNFQAELGYVMNPAYSGKGYMTEAGQALLKLGFEILGLERVYAIRDERNEASGAVMKRLGMQQEGVLRHVNIDKDGEFVNDVYASILKADYLKLNERE